MILIELETVSIFFLFFSFYQIYNYSPFICFGIFFFTSLLHLVYYILYEKYFHDLQEQLQIQKKSILSFAINFKQDRKFKDSPECNICFDNINKKEIVSLKCDCKEKYYHEECLISWFSKGRTICPFCRRLFDFPSLYERRTY